MEIKHKACPCPNCIAVLSLLVNLWVDCPQFLSLSKKKHLLVLYTERERVTHSHRWMNQRCSRIWQGGRGEERGQRCSSPSHDKPPFPIQILHRSSPYSNGQKRLGDLYSTHRPCQKKKKLHGAMDQVHCGLRPRTPAHYHHGSMASSVWSTANGFFMFMRGPFSCSSATDMANLYLPKWFIFLDIQWSLWIVEIDSDCSSFLASLVDHINITHK